jgi:hypothetical protein
MRGSPVPIPKAMHVPSIQFLREQDGAPERLLKAQLAQLFLGRKAILRTYLAQFVAGTSVGVALCLRTSTGPDADLVKDVGSVFARIFGSHEHLDILFLSEEQETLLITVCRPFYSIPSN